MYQQKRKILEDFKGLNVYDDKGLLRSDCRIKKYVDGSRYEGQLVGEKRIGLLIYNIR